MYPIWVEKGSYVKFRVFGKWRIDSQYPYTDSTGIPTSLVQGFNNGSLVGRIGSSDYFGIKDPTVKYASISGPLYLKMNLPKLKLSPSGMLTVKVYDAKKMDNNDINKKRGWYETSDENTNFSLGHLEYDRLTLDAEYKRDKNKGLPIELPVNYYPDDDDTKKPLLRWRSHGNILYSNWLNYYVYQETPYEFINTDLIYGK